MKNYKFEIPSHSKYTINDRVIITDTDGYFSTLKEAYSFLGLDSRESSCGVGVEGIVKGVVTHPTGVNKGQIMVGILLENGKHCLISEHCIKLIGNCLYEGDINSINSINLVHLVKPKY